ncbi:MAG: hypothetical protein A3J74_06665 [Elusimicrobia bacterium RIFCSPHIGHO2_02_FULL_57_9]|nr:MAG: hypothetical protein A3J74_06665 [Elusimicrobia bacterium RIFCSPHIGHO2_02_FULL_57_9]
MRIAALTLLLAGISAGGPSGAQEPESESASSQRVSAWLKQGSSLLFYDQSGALVGETGLGVTEDPTGTRVNVRDIRAGASPNGRFAWTMDKTTVWDTQRTKILETRRRLRFFGTSGKELWSSTDADMPENGEPLIFSRNGEKVLMALNTDKGWSVLAKKYTGNTLLQVGPFPILQLMSLTPNGRYALVRWAVPDHSATHTFFETEGTARKDIPSGELYMGLAHINDEGKIHSGKKFIFDLSESSDTVHAPVQP